MPQTRTPTSASNSRPTSLHEDSRQKTLAQQAKAMSNAEQRKQAIASATAAAQKWSNLGWGSAVKEEAGPESRADCRFGTKFVSPYGQGPASSSSRSTFAEATETDNDVVDKQYGPKKKAGPTQSTGHERIWGIPSYRSANTNNETCSSSSESTTKAKFQS